MTEKLYLGVARSVITPEIGGHLMGYNNTTFSTAVNDDLTASVFAFEQGNICSMMITLSLCMVGNDIYDEVATLLSEKFDIPKHNIIMCAIHTHSAPMTKKHADWVVDRKYVDEILFPEILKAAEEAVGAKAPVKVGIGQGESLIAINRRQLMPDNTVQLGQNPWGPLDKRMTIVSFKGEDGRPVANIIHYGCHSTAAGNNTEITRDWSGPMVDVVERDSGALTAFFNGCIGDTGPRCTNGYTTGRGNIDYAMELGGYAARDAMTIFETIKVYRDVDMLVFGGTVDIPLDKRISKEEAEKLIEPYKGKVDGGFKNFCKTYYQAIIKSYEEGYVDVPAKQIRQTIIRIGDVAFVSTPFELFTEIGMRIDAYCGDIPYVLSLSYANGSELYFATEDQICRGGYEVNMHKMSGIQQYSKDADYALICGTLENLKKLSKGN